MASRFAKRRKRASGETTKVALGSLLIVLVLICVGGLLYTNFTVERAPRLDASFCPIDGPRGILVVLIDASDELPAITKQEIHRQLLDIAESLPSYHLLELHVLGSKSSGGRVEFRRCNPGDGTGLSDLTGNPALARKRWLESFQKPVEAALSGSLKPEQSTISPIMETVQRIAVERFSGRAAEALPKKLILVSDMMENTPDYSQYRGDLTYLRFKNSTAYRKYRTDLKGADVAIRYVQRASNRPISSVEHIRFWTDWVRDNNGKLVDAVRLQGLG